MTHTISNQIVDTLHEFGVKRIYGIPGDTIDSLMEALRKQSNIQFVIMRHEENGAFAAVAHGKLTGELGVVAACQGPGANHLINGLYDAFADRVPVLAITGALDNEHIGTRMPQETNQIKLFDDCTVFNQEVRSAANLPHVLELAIHTAVTMRGPAHVSIPADIMREVSVPWKTTTLDGYLDYTVVPNENVLQRAAEVINKAKKPTILFGEGSRDAANELITLSEMLQAPLVHTARSKDIVSDDHPNNVGGVGLMGAVSGNHAVSHTDCLVIVGSNYAWREFYPKDVPVIQIDVRGSRLATRTVVTHPVVGDSKPTLQALIPLLNNKTDDHYLNECRQKLRGIHSKLAFDPKKSDNENPVHPQAFMYKLNQHAPDNTIYLCDAGTVTVWANNILHLKPKQRFVWCANLASLGNALGYAIGAKFTYPDRPVIALCGDGGFQMSIADLPTAVMYNLPIIFVIYNNSTYRFIELEEEGEGNPPFGTHFENPDYAKLAEAHGAMGIRVNHYDEIDEKLTQALSANKPVVMDVIINPEELIIPPVFKMDQAFNFAMATVKSWFTK